MEPTPSPLAAQPQLSPLDQYMQTYGQQLQSMLAEDPNQGQPTQGPSADAGAVSNLGPDLYRSGASFTPSQSALQAPGQDQSQGAPQSALGQGSDKGAADDGQGTSFRDLWQKQSSEQRQQYIDKLQEHLKATNETIDSAYKTMMQQLGGRPQSGTTKQEKGMLLMEFGLRMMEHSRPQQGQAASVGGAIGQAGTETLQSYKNLQAQKLANQQKYDALQQQLTIAQGKEKAQLASRSALEEGRDIRSLGAQNASILRTQMQQQGAGARTDARNAAAAARTDVTEAGKNQRAANAAGQVKRTVTADDGSMYGVTGTGSVIQLGKNGQPLKAAPGGGGAGKLTAAQANYNLYMSTYGKDEQGNALQGQDLQKVQHDALTYAANPRSFQLTDPQMRQMASKSADTFIRANPTSFLGMSPDEIGSKRAEVAEQEYQRLKRGGPAGTGVSSALAPGPHASGAAPKVGKGGQPPTQPPPGSQAPNDRQLAALRQDPAKIAPFFLKKFGYLPPEYHKFAQQAPQSALSP